MAHVPRRELYFRARLFVSSTGQISLSGRSHKARQVPASPPAGAFLADSSCFVLRVSLKFFHQGLKAGSCCKRMEYAAFGCKHGGLKGQASATKGMARQNRESHGRRDRKKRAVLWRRKQPFRPPRRRDFKQGRRSRASFQSERASFGVRINPQSVHFERILLEHSQRVNLRTSRAKSSSTYAAFTSRRVFTQTASTGCGGAERVQHKSAIRQSTGSSKGLCVLVCLLLSFVRIDFNARRCEILNGVVLR